MASSKELPARLTELAGANTALAVHLYQTLRNDFEGQNLFFAPISISMVVAMSYLGANGNTATQIADVFKFSLVRNGEIHEAFRDLRRLLNRVDYFSTLRFAAQLYGRSGCPFEESFIEGAKNYYRSLPKVVEDFSSPEAKRAINDWISKWTEGKITNFVAPETLDLNTSLVLVNAIYFKALWWSKFSEEMTKTDVFKVADDRQTVPVNFMTKTSGFNLVEDALNDCLVLELLYARSCHSMLVVLPMKDDGLADLEAKLSVDLLHSWVSNLQQRQVEVILPKFKVEAQFSLQDTLAKMGMPDAFDAAKANFSGITSGEELFISAVLHSAFVDVNERGTEAAAVTMMDSGTLSYEGVPQEPVTFRADHPFFFCIRHIATSSVLFIGRVTEPTHALPVASEEDKTGPKGASRPEKPKRPACVVT